LPVPPLPQMVQRRSLLKVVLLALAAATLNAALAVKSAHYPGSHPASIVHPGAQGPSARVLIEDFPEAKLPRGIGHDGQQFYAIARQPTHLGAIAPDLDMPRYRLQRIAFPLLVWMLHPQGGGRGLIIATVIVGALALFAGGLATGVLALQLGGPLWLTLLFALWPGAFMSMRLSTADNFALAAGLGALVFSLAGRHRWALVAGVLATLAKESTWLLLLGLALHRRDRRGIYLAAVPAAVAGAWWLALRLLVEDNSPGLTIFTLPLAGLWACVQYWSQGNTLFAYFLVPLAFAIGAWALVRVKLRHTLGPAILLQMLFLAFLGVDSLGLDANGSRITMPLMLLGSVALAANLRARRNAANRSAS
jgi:hypothetical protein